MCLARFSPGLTRKERMGSSKQTSVHLNLNRRSDTDSVLNRNSSGSFQGIRLPGAAPSSVERDPAGPGYRPSISSVGKSFFNSLEFPVLLLDEDHLFGHDIGTGSKFIKIYSAGKSRTVEKCLIGTGILFSVHQRRYLSAKHIVHFQSDPA